RLIKANSAARRTSFWPTIMSWSAAAANLRAGDGKSIGVRGRSAFGFMAPALFPKRAPDSRAKPRSKRCCGKWQKPASGTGPSAETCGSLRPARRRVPGPAFERVIEGACFAVAEKPGNLGNRQFLLPQITPGEIKTQTI